MINLLRQRQTGHIIKLLLYIILGGGMAALPVVIGSMYLHSGMGHVYGVSCVYADSGGGPRGDGSGPVGAEDGRWEAKAGDKELEECLARAAALAAGYDYDAAIALLSDSAYAESAKAQAAVSEYRAVKSTLVRADPGAITHIFFHTLIMDPSKAFDGDAWEKKYWQIMVTGEEFQKILQSLYERGFVLVQMHDIAYETTAEDGSVCFKEGDIMLPPGKKALVMSQDDVCYYEYMEGDGFASRIVIGEDGRPACEMRLDDGSIAVGSYDLVPILEDFIDEHPDFSYRGARAVLTFTGYNGILGYRTAPSYVDIGYVDIGFDYEQEREDAARVAECLKACGYELASHTWGHRNMGLMPLEDFIRDTDQWEEQVEPLIGPCDIIAFPFGSDIGDWRPYDTKNERFQYLYSKGFRYFCNVDTSQYYIQIGEKHMRQGRRNIDGIRMYYDLPESGVGNGHLSDLFDVREVYDRRRPLPVR